MVPLPRFPRMRSCQDKMSSIVPPRRQTRRDPQFVRGSKLSTALKNSRVCGFALLRLGDGEITARGKRYRRDWLSESATGAYVIYTQLRSDGPGVIDGAIGEEE